MDKKLDDRLGRKANHKVLEDPAKKFPIGAIYATGRP